MPYIVLETNKSKSGIYKIYNKLNKRIYIGSCKNFYSRWSKHKNNLITNKHKNKYLQNDWNKCGEENFEFKILDIIDSGKEDRLFVKQIYLNYYYDFKNNCYNIKRFAVSSDGNCWSKNPEETKKKISLARKGKVAWNKNKKHTIESKKKMSLIKIGNKNLLGFKFSTKSKEKMSLSHKGNIPSNTKNCNHKLISPNGIIYESIYNLTKFCRDNNISRGSIYLVIVGKRQHYKGWKLFIERQ